MRINLRTGSILENATRKDIIEHYEGVWLIECTTEEIADFSIEFMNDINLANFDHFDDELTMFICTNWETTNKEYILTLPNGDRIRVPKIGFVCMVDKTIHNAYAMPIYRIYVERA